MSRPVLLPVLLVLALVAPGAVADERAAARRFEEARRDEPSLIAFLQRMPKGGDLHVHTSGSVYAEYALDSALKSNLFFDPATNQFTREDGPGRLPAQRLLEGQAGEPLSRFLDAASMRGLRPGVGSGHDHFFRAFPVVGSGWLALTGEQANAEALAEVVARARAQNQQYLELMAGVAPDAAYDLLRDPPAYAVEDPARALTELTPKLDEFVRLARAYLDAQDVELARRLGVPAPLSGAQGPVTVRYIVAANRLSPDAVFFARVAAGMALMRADRRVVGVNILAPEDHPFARTHFDTQMRLLDVLWRHFGQPNITLHAGELTLAVSPPEPMRERIRRSIQVGHARRIGHGVSVAWEDDLPGLLRHMKQNRIAVEVCLTSNDAILDVRGDRHPFNLYRRAGVPVSLNTDDEGINRSTLTMEFVRAVRTYNLSYAEVKELARNSIEYAFLPGDSLFLEHRYDRPRPALRDVGRPGWKPSSEAQALLAGSEKMRVQMRLEQAFAAFEN
jgi:adenosine deaminase